MDMEGDASMMSFPMRPSYIDGPQESTQRISEFDERIRKNIADDLLEEEDATTKIGDNEKITTYLRIRPLSKNCIVDSELGEVYTIANPRTLVVSHQPRNKTQTEKTESRFTFTKVLGSSDSQSSVFEDCMHPILDKFFLGENCLVFSYGATNSGKTFTMQGYGVNYGVIPRTLEYLYNRLEERLYKKGNIKPNQVDAYFVLEDAMTERLEGIKERILRVSKCQSQVKSFSESLMSSSGASSRPDRMNTGLLSGSRAGAGKYSLPLDSTLYCVWISFAEIYNEKVYDLFDRGEKKKEMRLVQNKQGQVYVQDLTECCAHSAEEAYQLFLAGKQNLHSGATNMNANSSRSHSIFSIRMVAVGVGVGNVDVYYPKKVLRITFCDLAGIERVSQTKNVGNRLKESTNINNSLMMLLRCIRAMRNEQNGRQTSSVLAFRDSKLSRLFRSFLTTASRICMIASINPDPQILDSTLQVLQNCAVASQLRVQKFLKVEVPENNSQFARRVRASIAAGTTGLSSRIDLESTLESNQDSEDESEYNLPTVVSKKPTTEVERLKIEIRALKEKVNTIAAETRKEVSEVYENLLKKQECQYSQLHLQTKSASQNLNRRRISLAAKMHMNNLILMEMEGINGSPIYENSPPHGNITHCTNVISPGAGDGNEDNQLLNKDEQLILFSDRNVELMGTVRDLQEIIAKKDARSDETVKRLEEMLENEKQTNDSKIKGLDQEVKAAEVLCIQYHQNLNEANKLAELRTEEFNRLNQETEIVKEERDYLLSALTELKGELDLKKKRVLELEDELSSCFDPRKPRKSSEIKTFVTRSSRKKCFVRTKPPVKGSNGNKKKKNISKGLNSDSDSFSVDSLSEDEENEEDEESTPRSHTPFRRLAPTPKSMAHLKFVEFSPALEEEFLFNGPASGRRSLHKSKLPNSTNFK